MNAHNRMFRTLASLVASMTIGAVCLKWMLPPQPTVAATGTTLIARGSVEERPARDPAASWAGIRVDARPENAVDTHTTAHFVVGRDGKPVPTNQWLGQRPIGSEPLIRIALLASSGSRQATDAQTRGIRDLVADLHRLYDIPADRVIWDRLTASPQPLPSGRS
jgi:hypothetical protein